MNVKVKDFLIKNNAMWVVTSSDSNHPELASGKHANTYINCAKVMANSNLVRMLLNSISDDILRHLTYSCNTLCGLQTGGMALAYILPHVFPFMSTLSVIYTDKQREHEIVRWSVNNINKPILLIDDVKSEGSSLYKCISKYDSDIFYDTIICLFNLTGSDNITINGKNFGIVSALNLNVGRWSSNECPSCKKGSTPVRPKDSWGI